MRGVGVLQEIERQTWSDLPRSFDPVVKRSWRIDQARQLPRAMSQAFNTMLTGRPGPALITLPMDVQAEAIPVAALPTPQPGAPRARPRGDPEEIRRAAELLAGRTAAGDPPGRRRGAGGRRSGSPRPGRAPGRRRRDHHAGQGRLPGGPSPLRLAHGRQRHDLRQSPDEQRRRDPGHRRALRRQGDVVLPARLCVQHPAHAAHPRRHRSVRDRQELPGRRRHRRRRRRRSP